MNLDEILKFLYEEQDKLPKEQGEIVDEDKFQKLLKAKNILTHITFYLEYYKNIEKNRKEPKITTTFEELINKIK